MIFRIFFIFCTPNEKQQEEKLGHTKVDFEAVFIAFNFLFFTAQGCSKCKDMCCEKPPTTRPPTTTPTTTPTTVTTTKITTTEQLTVPAINDRNGESGEETMARTKEDTNATTITSRPRTTQIHTTIETVLASTQKTKIEANKITTKPSVTFKFGGEGNNTVEGKSLKSTGTQSNSKHGM